MEAQRENIGEEYKLNIERRKKLECDLDHAVSNWSESFNNGDHSGIKIYDKVMAEFNAELALLDRDWETL